MSTRGPRIAYLTAGAAGMFCGSYLHDNTLAAALNQLGCDVWLIPTYTPIRTDEEDVSIDKVFYGGINVFLQQKSSLFRKLPMFLDRWLDKPWLINLLASRGMETDARMLGGLAVSMLRGEQGYQAKEVARLVTWLAEHAKPELVNLSNLLIGGCIPAIKRTLKCPVIVTLQGDDLFLDDLIPPYREQALAELRKIGAMVDGFIVFSQYYADHMAEHLGLPRERFRIVPLGLKTDDFLHPNQGKSVVNAREGGVTIGYFARICPAKGFHVLLDAFTQLKRKPGMDEVRLKAAGWLGAGDRKFFDEHVAKLQNAGFEEHFQYLGIVDRKQKLEFYRSIDVLSAPTTYREPKGIFVLESLASGVPVVQPEHGAFPEILAATGGGRLVRPNDATHLAEVLAELIADPATRVELGQRGRQAVHERFHARAMAEKTLAVYREFLM